MVSRIKVVNDIGELVSIFHAADTDVKRRLLLDLASSWVTMPQIDEKYGTLGKKALLYLDKIKLIESQWITSEKGPEKAYHTYYTSVQINLLGSMGELADIIYATTFSDVDLEKYEEGKSSCTLILPWCIPLVFCSSLFQPYSAQEQPGRIALPRRSVLSRCL